MPGAHGIQKLTSDPLGMELRVVVGHHMGPGNQTQVFWRSSQLSKPRSYLSGTRLLLFKILFVLLKDYITLLSLEETLIVSE